MKKNNARWKLIRLGMPFAMAAAALTVTPETIAFALDGEGGQSNPSGFSNNDTPSPGGGSGQSAGGGTGGGGTDGGTGNGIAGGSDQGSGSLNGGGTGLGATGNTGTGNGIAGGFRPRQWFAERWRKRHRWWHRSRCCG